MHRFLGRFGAPLLLCASLLVVVGAACGDDDDDDDPTATAESSSAAMPIPYPFENPTVTDSGLEYVDTVVGDGEEVATGDRVTAHYTGTFLDGEVFDSSEGRDPFTFTVGVDRVIDGWHEGLVGMKVGGTRLLYLPSELAYGAQGRAPVIPPNTPLLFEIQLLGVD